MRNLFCFAAIMGLTACDQLPTFDLPLPSFGGSKGQSEITVTRDDVTLGGSRGFCVDKQSSTLGSTTAFVVFGNCAAITGARMAPQPDVNAIVTATVRLADPTFPRIGSSSTQLAGFFNTEPGQTLLSRSADPSKVTLKESGATKEGSFFLYVTDTSDGAPDGTEDTYWRAYLDAKNSVVTVSVLSLEANPLTREEGLRILRQFSDNVRSNTSAEETPAPVPSGSAQRPVERPKVEGASEPQKSRKGILGRLFG